MKHQAFPIPAAKSFDPVPEPARCPENEIPPEAVGQVLLPIPNLSIPHYRGLTVRELSSVRLVIWRTGTGA